MDEFADGTFCDCTGVFAVLGNQEKNAGDQLFSEVNFRYVLAEEVEPDQPERRAADWRQVSYV